MRNLQFQVPVALDVFLPGALQRHLEFLKQDIRISKNQFILHKVVILKSVGLEIATRVRRVFEGRDARAPRFKGATRARRVLRTRRARAQKKRIKLNHLIPNKISHFSVI